MWFYLNFLLRYSDAFLWLYRNPFVFWLLTNLMRSLQLLRISLKHYLLPRKSKIWKMMLPVFLIGWCLSSWDRLGLDYIWASVMIVYFLKDSVSWNQAYREAPKVGTCKWRVTCFIAGSAVTCSHVLLWSSTCGASPSSVTSKWLLLC